MTLRLVEPREPEPEPRRRGHLRLVVDRGDEKRPPERPEPPRAA